MSTRIETSLPAQLERMEKARDARAAGRMVLRDTRVTLSHGSGGRASQQLLEAVILPAFGAPLANGFADAAVFPPEALAGMRLAFTTDSYVVSPLFFPGADIGRLAVHGTINDLAVAGARPLALSVALVLEEGLEIDVLRRVVASIAAAAAEAGVHIVTGDTKVVPRGKADALFVTTTGVGAVPMTLQLDAQRIVPGDVVLVSGYIGDHGMAVMLARETLELEAEIRSDSAPLDGLVADLLRAAPATRVLKDPTRGGMASALNEIARRVQLCIEVDEEHVPVRAEVRGACEILGIDPLHIANEGKLVAVVAPAEAAAALAALRANPLGHAAARIGVIRAAPPGMVVLRTGVGGSRVLDMLVGDALPRIC